MAINKPTIAAGPTYTRERVQTVIGKITSVIPPGSRRYISENNTVIIENQTAEREGQMLFYRDGVAFDVQIYVVVTINNVLLWKPVLPTAQIQNSANGRAWDPLAGFYDPLVS